MSGSIGPVAGREWQGLCRNGSIEMSLVEEKRICAGRRSDEPLLIAVSGFMRPIIHDPWNLHLAAGTGEKCPTKAALEVPTPVTSARTGSKEDSGSEAASSGNGNSPGAAQSKVLAGGPCYQPNPDCSLTNGRAKISIAASHHIATFDGKPAHVIACLQYCRRCLRS